MEVEKKDPYQVFEEELPEFAARFDAVVQAQVQSSALDAKVKQLINIAIQTANRNPTGVTWHAAMAREQGASRQQVIAAVAMNLHLTCLAAVLEGLPAAVDGYEMPLMSR